MSTTSPRTVWDVAASVTAYVPMASGWGGAAGPWVHLHTRGAMWTFLWPSSSASLSDARNGVMRLMVTS